MSAAYTLESARPAWAAPSKTKSTGSSSPRSARRGYVIRYRVEGEEVVIARVRRTPRAWRGSCAPALSCARRSGAER